MGRFLLRFLCLLGVVGAGCDAKERTPASTIAPVSSDPASDPATVAAHNRAIAAIERAEFQQAETILLDLARKYPHWLDVKIDAAVAISPTGYSLRDSGERKRRTVRLLEEVLSVDPKHPRANFCMGVLLRDEGDLEKLEKHFRIATEAGPCDGFAAMALGDCLDSQGNDDEALHWFRRAIDSVPEMRWACYRLASHYRRIGERQQSEHWFRVWAQIRESPFVKKQWRQNYCEPGRLMEFPPLHSADRRNAMPASGLFGEPTDLFGGGRTTWSKLRGVDGPSITACDIDGDGRVDLFIARAFSGGPIANAVYLQQPDGSLELNEEHPLASPTGVNAVLWGDVNNDGLPDAYLCCKGGDQMWLQTARNVWTNATAKCGVVGSIRSRNGILADLDHDGVLEILTIDVDGRIRVLANTASLQSHRSCAEPVYADETSRRAPETELHARQLLPLDADGDRALDVLMFRETPRHLLWSNQYEKQLTRTGGVDGLWKTEVLSAVAGDLDGDGSPEIYTADPTGVTGWARDRIGLWRGSKKTNAPPRHPGFGSQLAIADFAGNGRLCLWCKDDLGWTVWAPDADGGLKQVHDEAVPDLIAAAVVEGDSASGPLVVGMSAGRRPQVWGAGSNRGRFVSVALKGDFDRKRNFSNRSGIGSLLKARLGARWSVQFPLSQSSGPGQSLTPHSLGVGASALPDFLSIDWPNGDHQTEVDLPIGRTTTIVEKDR